MTAGATGADHHDSAHRAASTGHRAPRDAEEILAGALGRARELTPAWNLDDPAEPGRVLLELSSWLAEQTRARIDALPDALEDRLLDMIGVRARPATPARGPIVVRRTRQGVVCPSLAAGTCLQASPPGGPPREFSLRRELRVTGAVLDTVLLEAPDGVRDVPVEDGALLARLPLEQEDLVLVLAFERVLAGVDGERVELHLPGLARRFRRALRIECRRGEGWQDVPCEAPPDESLLVLDGASLAGLETTPVDAVGVPPGSLMLRLTIPGAAPGALDAEAISLVVGRDAGVPERLLARREGRAVDLGAALRLGETARLQPPAEPGEAVLLIALPDICRRGGRLHLDFRVAGPLSARLELIPWRLVWEVTTDDRRIALGGGRIGTRGEGADPARLFRDGTRGLSRSGTLRLDLPSPLTAFPVDGTTAVWLSLRLEPCEEHPARAELPAELRAPLDPLPALSALRLAVESAPCAPAMARRERAGRLELLAASRDDSEDDEPSLLLGLRGWLPRGPLSLWLSMDEQRPWPGGIHRWTWEARAGGDWQRLDALSDETSGGRRSGPVALSLPSLEAAELHGHECIWLRLRGPGLERLDAVLINAGEVETGRRVALTSAGEHDGLPDFELALHAGEDRDRILLGLDEIQTIEDGVALTWLTVEDFGDSTATDRHVVLDLARGLLRFGDGRHGRVPPRGTPVQILGLHSTDAALTELPAELEWQLPEDIAGLREIRNPAPLTGGRSAESVSELRRRGARLLHSGASPRSAGDWEELIGRRHPAVAAARAERDSSGSGRIILRVLQRGPRPATGRLLDELEASIADLIPLGLGIELRPARLRPVRLQVRFTPDAEPDADRLARIHDQLVRSLDPAGERARSHISAEGLRLRLEAAGLTRGLLDLWLEEPAVGARRDVIMAPAGGFLCAAPPASRSSLDNSADSDSKGD